MAVRNYIQIPNLPVGLAIQGTEQFEMVQNGVSRRTTAADIATYVRQQSGATTVALLPLPIVVGAGARAFVLDATSAVFNALAVGGGTNKMPVVSDGSIWKIG